MRQMIAEELQMAGKWRKVKKLASLVGKVIALEPAIGPVAQLLTRSAQSDIAGAVQLAGWKTSTKVSANTCQALQLLSDEIQSFNGHKIKSVATAIPLQQPDQSEMHN